MSNSLRDPMTLREAAVGLLACILGLAFVVLTAIEFHGLGLW